MGIAQDMLGWSDERTAEFVATLRRIGEETLKERFWDPVAGYVLKQEDGHFNRIANTLGMPTSTPKRWRYPEVIIDGEPRPAQDGSVPDSLPMFKLFCAYSLDPVEFLPEGRAVAVQLWQRWVAELDQNLPSPDRRVGREIGEDELYCLHVVHARREREPDLGPRRTDEWADEVLVAVEPLLTTKKSKRYVTTRNDVTPACQRWSRHIVILQELVPLHWYYDDLGPG